jgi:hypothetical protein
MVSRTICWGWLWTMFLLILASWVARIISVTHWAWPFGYFGYGILQTICLSWLDLSLPSS